MRLAASLNALRCTGALDGHVVWYVIDDATTNQAAVDGGALQSLCDPHDIEVTVVGQRHFEIVSDVLIKSPLGAEVSSWMRRPGTGQWDAAGVRNLAACIAMARGARGDLVYWIDDDIVPFHVPMNNGCDVYYDYECIGRNMHNGEGVRAARNQLQCSDAVVAGVRYIGVADLSVRSHIAVAIERAGEGGDGAPDISGVAWPTGSGFPLAIDYVGGIDEVPAYRGPSGVSSGFMIAQIETLARAPFPRFYNEDWLWVVFLGDPAQIAIQSDSRVAHLPPLPGEATVSRMVYQEIGDAVFDAVNARLKELRKSTEAGSVIDALGEHGIPAEMLLHYVMNGRRALESLDAKMGDLSPCVRWQRLRSVVSSARMQFDEIDCRALGEQLQETTRLVVNWRRAFGSPSIRDTLKHALNGRH